MKALIAELFKGLPAEGSISELHAWIGIDRDGNEGVLSADMPMPFGMRHCPLMSTKRGLAEKLKPMAEQAQNHAMRNGLFLSLELRTFIIKPPNAATEQKKS